MRLCLSNESSMLQSSMRPFRTTGASFFFIPSLPCCLRSGEHQPFHPHSALSSPMAVAAAMQPLCHMTAASAPRPSISPSLRCHDTQGKAIWKLGPAAAGRALSDIPCTSYQWTPFRPSPLHLCHPLIDTCPVPLINDAAHCSCRAVMAWSLVASGLPYQHT